MPTVAEVPSGLSLTPPRETKKKQSEVAISSSSKRRFAYHPNITIYSYIKLQRKNSTQIKKAKFARVT
jgi:hypothetical protein